MALYFLSDIHLTGNSDPRSEALAGLLSASKPDDDFIIGGDLFDLYVGNKRAFRVQHQKVIEAIESAARRGVRILYFEGNHDFHMQGVFAAEKNITVHQDERWHNFGDAKIYIAHGDRLDPQDHGYHFLRFITRTWLCRLLIWLLPDLLVSKVGEWSSKQSRKYNDLASAAEGNPNIQRVRSLFIDFAQKQIAEGARVVLLGHSHIADDKKWDEKGKTAQYINLGYSPHTLRFVEMISDALPAQIKEVPAR